MFRSEVPVGGREQTEKGDCQVGQRGLQMHLMHVMASIGSGCVAIESGCCIFAALMPSPWHAHHMSDPWHMAHGNTASRDAVYFPSPSRSPRRRIVQPKLSFITFHASTEHEGGLSPVRAAVLLSCVPVSRPVSVQFGQPTTLRLHRLYTCKKKNIFALNRADVNALSESDLFGLVDIGARELVHQLFHVPIL
jgi:hypothetical protein